MYFMWVLKHRACVRLSPVIHSWTDTVKSNFSILGLSHALWPNIFSLWLNVLIHLTWTHPQGPDLSSGL